MSQRTTIESENEAKPRRKRRRIRPLYVLVGSFLTGVVVLAACYGMWQWSLANQIAEEYRKIRERGEPITPAELREYVAIPAGVTDLTEQWQDVLTTIGTICGKARYQLLKSPESEKRFHVPRIDEPWPEESLVADLMAELEPSFSAVESLVQREGEVVFPLKYHNGFDMVLPVGGKIRPAVSSHELRAYWQVRQGLPSEAIESLIAMRAIGDTLSADQVAISHIMRGYCLGRMNRATLSLLPHAQWSHEQIARLQHAIEEYDISYIATMKRSLIGERVGGIMFFEKGIGLERYDAGTLPRFVTRRADQLLYLQEMQRAVWASDRPLPLASPVYVGITLRSQNKSQWNQMLRPHATEVMPALIHFHSYVGESVADDRATVILLACQRYYLDHSGFPAEITELVPKYLAELPVDPFDLFEEPLKYLRSENKLTIYSIGYNQIDDGGVPPADAADDWDDDYTLSLNISNY